MPADILDSYLMDYDSDSRASSRASTSSLFKTPTLPLKIYSAIRTKEKEKTPNGVHQPKDVVAFFSHSELANPEQATFIRHRNRSRTVYEVKDSGTDRVKHIGLPVKEDDGYEYVVAKVSRITRKPMEFYPVDLVKFEAKYNADEIIQGTSNIKRSTDYSADYSIITENYMQKKQDLISEFGGLKKNKTQESMLRRKITDDTLSAMTLTAFASPATLNDSKSLIKSEDIKPEVAQQSSMILPKANLLAVTPIDVYPLSLFRTHEDVERYGKTAVGYFKQHENEDKLIKSNVPVFVARKIGDVLNKGKLEEKAFLALKLIAMAKYITYLNSNTRKKTISFDDLDAFKLPEAFNMMIRTEFFAEKLHGKRFGVTTVDKEKLMAHFLCLALIYDTTNMELSIAPICLEMHTSEKKVVSILEALGCVITQSNSENPDMKIRIGRLVGPPKEKIKANRKRKTL